MRGVASENPRRHQPAHATRAGRSPDACVGTGGSARVARARRKLCVVPQNYYEFWVVATRPFGSNGLDLSIVETLDAIERMRRVFTLLRDERAIFREWRRLVAEHEVKGKKAHDARLVAAMLRHRLTHILTFNRQDFIQYPNIVVLTPNDVLGQTPDHPQTISPVS